MTIGDYASRALDYIPFISIAKGIYYITKANQREKVINNIANDILKDENTEKISSKDASVIKEYSNFKKMQVRAIKIRGGLACIPIIGNLLIAIHDIRGHFIKGGYNDSMDALSKWNI